MQKSTYPSILQKVLLGLFLIGTTGFSIGQISGVKSVPSIEYPTIASFITDLNTLGVGPGGVTLNVDAGYVETAPAGGFIIGASASGSLGNPVIITGNGLPKPIITASSSLVAGNLNDAIFKIIGADFITLSNLELRENAANTTTAAATNNMTEWGVALLYATTTDGAQNCSIIENTITLNRTYQNTFGIYSNSTHSATAVSTSVTATGTSGGNSGLKIYSNTISNVNNGIIVVGPTAGVDHNNLVEVGGSSTTGNTITNYGTTGTFSSYANVSGTVNGILVRNSINVTVSNNSITSSNGGTTVGTLNGIQFPAFSSAPTGSFTQNVNNNQISLTHGLNTGAMNGILISGTSASVLSTINVNNNNFSNFDHSTATATGAITFLSQGGTHLNQNILGNTFSNLVVKTTGSVTFISNSNTLPAGGVKNVNNNSIVTAFNKTGAGGTVTLFTDNGSDPLGTINNTNNNNFSNITVTGATILNGLSNTNGGTPAKSVSGNTLTNWTGGTSTITAINQNFGGNNTTVSNNVINNITSQGVINAISIGTSNSGANQVINGNNINNIISTGVGGNVTGILSQNSTVTTLAISNNTIFNLSTTNASGQVFGINSVISNTANIFNNTIYDLSASGVTNPAVAGIQMSGAAGTQNIYKNKIYSLSASGAFTIDLAVNGISIQGGLNVNAYNNLISGITAPLANATNALSGIRVSSTVLASNIRLYYNSIYVNGTSSGANFGSSGIFHTGSTTSTTANLDLRNNIIINECIPTGTGVVVAFRRATANATNLAAGSNNNLLYAGTPSLTNLIYTDGTTPQQTLIGYQTNVLPLGHDAGSFTGEAPFAGLGYGSAGNFFISLTGSNADFLRPVSGITSQVESGAVNITTPLITDDYSGVIRGGNPGYSGTGTNPDLGALEFNGISPAPVITLNSVTPSATPQCTTSSRLVSVTITTISGTITAANIGYSVNGVPQANIPMTNTSGNIWEGTIPASTPTNALIAWGVAATNSLGLNGSYTGTSYADEPLLGVSASASASVTTVCANDPVQLSASLNKTGSVNSGSGGGTSSAIAISPFYHNYGGAKTQFILRATELTAMGLAAGDITSLALNVTTVGTATLNEYSISMGHTAQAAAVANTAITSGLTQVYANAAQGITLGTNTYTFSTPFNWNGTSNIVISFSYSNNNAGGTSSTVTTDPVLSFNSSMAIAADNATAVCMLGAVATTDPCMGGTTFNQVSATRPRFTLTGNTPPAITSIQWMDGATPVGTGNPLTVNPTSTTTYTANITAAGCVYSPAPTVAVNVNPLPSAPTALNSSQCGTQIPTASVTSTSGLPTPTFIWYDAPVAGTALQTSTSTTYTSNVASTTTFYVAEENTSTGCESPRVAVTVTVASADNILASTSSASICIGGSVTLTAANTNPTPNQSYTYTWTSTTNSGVETSVNGASIVATPTQPGTYVYNLSGVDGGCNAVSSVNVTVNPFVAVISPVNVTCNGGNDGSFTLTSTSCGTAPFTYSLDGGATFGSIPSNLTAGSYNVIVKDANNYLTVSLPLTLTEPSTTITNPTVTNTSVCQNSLSAQLTANATLSTLTPATQVVSFSLAAQPTEVSGGSSFPTVATSPNIIMTANMSALPAGSVVTGATFNFNGLSPQGTSWGNDVGFGFTGAANAAYAAGTGAPSSTSNFNYTRTLPGAAITASGGTIQVHYYDLYADNTGAECIFPTGAGVATLTINYSFPTPATISWWDAPTGGTQVGTGSPLEAVGTSVLPNTTTPGTYTFYAQGQNGACPSPGRTAATVIVKAITYNTINETACDSYTLNTSTYTSSGTYTQTLTNAAGCDSIITLNLIINNSNASTTTITECDSYTWTNGVTYFTSGTHTQTLTNAAGCDSIATLNLTINYSNTGVDIIEACDSYTWIDGVEYTASNNTATFLLTNAAGCDSLVTLDLTINYSDATTDIIEACDSYTWIDGIEYTASNNTATFLLTNAAGCDSLVTLDLTINYSDATTDIIEACDSYTWIDGIEYTASNNTATFLLTNAAGCDSLVTLDLTINNSSSSSTTISVCDSYTWTDGVTYTSGGTYTQVLTNTAGCDSTAVLFLSITTSPVATATDDGNGTITSSIGTAYQWIDCSTDLPIAGEVSQTFTPTVNGTYAVIVYNDACDDTSTCVVIDYIGIKEISQEMIRLFPNPTLDFVTIKMSSSSAQVEVVDAQGKILETSTVDNGGTINLDAYETGIYLFRITTENGTTLHRISKN